VLSIDFAQLDREREALIASESEKIARDAGEVGGVGRYYYESHYSEEGGDFVSGHRLAQNPDTRICCSVFQSRIYIREMVTNGNDE